MQEKLKINSFSNRIFQVKMNRLKPGRHESASKYKNWKLALKYSNDFVRNDFYRYIQSSFFSFLKIYGNLKHVVFPLLFQRKKDWIKTCFFFWPFYDLLTQLWCKFYSPKQLPCIQAWKYLIESEIAFFFSLFSIMK